MRLKKVPTVAKSAPTFKTKKGEPTLFGTNIRTLEAMTVDRFRYFFIYDLEKFTEIPFPDCLQSCATFYKVENKEPLDQIDREAIRDYLEYQTVKLNRIVMDEMGIKISGIGHETALRNVERIRTETGITNQHLDIETFEVAPNDWVIMLIINLIF
jgi:hypothetical protein